jgi:fumarate reductase subunit D
MVMVVLVLVLWVIYHRVDHYQAVQEPLVKEIMVDLVTGVDP